VHDSDVQRSGYFFRSRYEYTVERASQGNSLGVDETGTTHRYENRAFKIFARRFDYNNLDCIDGHNDWANIIRGYYSNKIHGRHFSKEQSLVGHVDIGKLRKGHVGGTFWSAYVDW
jgi:hypothetical protein